MNADLPLHLQEIIFASSESALSRKISKLEKDGQLKKIAPRVYTPNLTEEPSDIIRRNIFKIIGRLYPGILLSHRSALEFKPTPTDNLFLTYTYSRKVNLPGITLNILEGPKPISGDNLFTDGLYTSQQERALLENLQESRKPGPNSKVLTIPELEERLEQIVRIKGEEGLNSLRDKTRQIANELGMHKEFTRLNKLIGAILSTKSSDLLKSPLAIARAFGQPYDPERISLFEKLFVELQQRTFPSVPELNTSVKAFRNFAFYEAYFSNYIEGTKFKVADARQIIESGKPMASRDEDSHDVLGTYQLVSNQEEMRITPNTPEEFLQILQYRHKLMLAARLTKNPGEFKDKNNYAGDTQFVDYTLVRGTLFSGFDFYRALNDPFAKAAYMMFMVSEVHPFLDGNGRLARVMMNAELVKGEQSKIIIPTVFREDYIPALRVLSRQHNPDVYIRMLQRAQQFTATIFGEDIDLMQNILERSNAFKEGDENILKIVN